MKDKIHTRIEYLSFSTNQNLVLDDPAEVTFINCGALGDQVVLNNNLTLDSHKAATEVTGSKYPYTLNVKMNSNEIDKTNYVIRFIGNTDPRLYVIVKYYVI